MGVYQVVGCFGVAFLGVFCVRYCLFYSDYLLACCFFGNLCCMLCACWCFVVTVASACLLTCRLGLLFVDFVDFLLVTDLLGYFWCFLVCRLGVVLVIVCCFDAIACSRGLLGLISSCWLLIVFLVW